MKFLLTVVVYLLIGFVVSWGVLLALKGSPWLLIVSLIGYVLAFAKLGCLPPKQSH